MNIKTSYKFILKSKLIAIAIFTFVILCTVLLSYIIGKFTLPDTVTVSLGGQEFSTCIFMFVIGMAGFKENINMLMQNNVTRKSMFISTTLNALTISGIGAVLNSCLNLAIRGISAVEANMSGSDMFTNLYSGRAMTMGIAGIFFESLILYFTIFLGVTAAGILLSIIYYRLSPAGKVILAAGLPVSIFVIIPILDLVVFNSGYIFKLIDFIEYATGIKNQNPYMGMLSYLVIFAVFTLFSWLGLRKAPFKA